MRYEQHKDWRYRDEVIAIHTTERWFLTHAFLRKSSLTSAIDRDRRWLGIPGIDG